jgi:hypothetical protein
MGALPDYGYSSAMKGGDLVWDRSTLDRFIADPDRVVPGNAMKPYGGLALAEEAARKALEPSGASDANWPRARRWRTSRCAACKKQLRGVSGSLAEPFGGTDACPCMRDRFWTT